MNLQNLKPISYYENQINMLLEQIKATNGFLSKATNDVQKEFGNKMNELHSKEIYHYREIVMHLRSINKLIGPLLN
jgi:hypothetical protein